MIATNMVVNWAFWFMALQVVTCLSGAVTFALQRNWPIAWVWLCYGLANVGFVIVAGKP
jgi:hypothetical protein